MSPLVSDLAVSSSVLAGTRATAEMLRVLRLPQELADREAVAVGGGQGDRVALDLDPHTGEHGQRVVTAGGDGHLGGGGGEDLTGDGAGRGRHLRQRRVLLHRQGVEGEPRGAADHGRPYTVCGDLHRAVGQGAADVGEQPAGDEDGALLLDLGVHRDPRRDLVVEAGEAQLRPPRPSAAGRRARAPADGPGGCGPPRPPPPRVRRAPPGSSP